MNDAKDTSSFRKLYGTEAKGMVFKPSLPKIAATAGSSPWQQSSGRQIGTERDRVESLDPRLVPTYT